MISTSPSTLPVVISAPTSTYGGESGDERR
jgi:hypothetical protein